MMWKGWRNRSGFPVSIILICVMAVGLTAGIKVKALGGTEHTKEESSGALFFVQEKGAKGSGPQAAPEIEPDYWAEEGETAAAGETAWEGATAAYEGYTAFGMAADAKGAGRSGAGSGENGAETADAGDSNETRSFVSGDSGLDKNELSAAECMAMEAFLNEEGSYGFLLSIYEVPQQIDAEQVFYLGAGLETATPTGEEKEAYLEEKGVSEDPNVLRLTRSQINDYLQYRAGVSIEDLYRQPDWTYLKDYDAYYLTHEEETTNLRRVSVLDAFEEDGLYTVHYREAIPAQHRNGFHIPVYEVVLRKNGDSYRFCSNRIWAEKDMLPEGTRKVAVRPGGFVTLYTYEPVTDVSERADASFVIVQNGDVCWNLPGWTKDNIRKAGTFVGVEGVDFQDFDGDGRTDILILCRYESLGEEGRKDGLEARLYHCRAGKRPSLDLKTSRKINKNVGNLTLTSAAHYLRTGEKWAKFRDYKEAYGAFVGEVPEDRYKGFALLNIEDGRLCELLMMGKDEQTGARIVSFHDGQIEEAQISRSFSYLRRLNLVCARRGRGGVFEETVYMFSGGMLIAGQRGIYGSLDRARTSYGKDGAPIYLYKWNGSPLSAQGYRDARSFIYDERHAVRSDSITLLTKEEILKELK